MLIQQDLNAIFLRDVTGLNFAEHDDKTDGTVPLWIEPPSTKATLIKPVKPIMLPIPPSTRARLPKIKTFFSSLR
jgi:hypothetical protein